MGGRKNSDETTAHPRQRVSSDKYAIVVNLCNFLKGNESSQKLQVFVELPRLHCIC